MSREPRPRNIGFIFKQMDKGVPPAQILSEVEGRNRRLTAKIKSSEKGSLSERIARNAISTHPNVTQALITPRRSPADIGLVDIQVNLTRIPYLNHVTVQVKSSESGIAYAKDELKNRMGFTDEELDSWLITNRLIFINGQATHEEIQKKFMDQVLKIKEANLAQKISKRNRSIIELNCLLIENGLPTNFTYSDNQTRNNQLACIVSWTAPDGIQITVEGTGTSKKNAREAGVVALTNLLKASAYTNPVTES